MSFQSSVSMRVALFGGSNYRMKFGFAHGLSKTLHVENFSLGATSSYQRLFELVKNRLKLSSLDLIILESALNDIQCYQSTGMDLELLLGRIDETYRQFASIGIPVLAILLPIRFDIPYLQEDATKQILERHRCNIEQYNFFIFDAAEYVRNKFTINLDVLFDDNLHLNGILACELGETVAAYLIRHHPSIINRRRPSTFKEEEYLVVTAQQMADAFGLKTTYRENSLFARNVVSLDRKLTLNKIMPNGYCLVGTETWSDDYSKLVIENNGNRICKLLNRDYLRFHDIHFPVAVEGRTYVCSGQPEDPVTEYAINAPSGRDHDVVPVGVTALLLKKSKVDNEFPKSRGISMGTCISEGFSPHSAFFHAVSKFQKKYKIVSFDPGIDVSDTFAFLRDTALRIEEENVELAYALDLNQAMVFCPSDPNARKKVAEYGRVFVGPRSNPPGKGWNGPGKETVFPVRFREGKVL